MLDDLDFFLGGLGLFLDHFSGQATRFRHSSGQATQKVSFPQHEWGRDRFVYVCAAASFINVRA